MDRTFPASESCELSEALFVSVHCETFVRVSLWVSLFEGLSVSLRENCRRKWIFPEEKALLCLQLRGFLRFTSGIGFESRWAHQSFPVDKFFVAFGNWPGAMTRYHSEDRPPTL
jgi:hypothetical protein